jgi:hypothetical protein
LEAVDQAWVVQVVGRALVAPVLADQDWGLASNHFDESQPIGPIQGKKVKRKNRCREPAVFLFQ